MSIGGDSLIDDVSKVVAGVLRRSKAIDFGALYGGTVLFSDGDRATVQPDDERLMAAWEAGKPDLIQIELEPGLGLEPSVPDSPLDYDEEIEEQCVDCQTETSDECEDCGEPLCARCGDVCSWCENEAS